MNRYDVKMHEFGVWRPESITAYGTPVSISESALASFESELGYSLPADYREFLRDYGGSEAHISFPLTENIDNKQHVGLSCFFGISHGINLLNHYHNAVLDFTVLTR